MEHSIGWHHAYGRFRVLYPDGQISQPFSYWVARRYKKIFGGKIVGRNYEKRKKEYQVWIVLEKWNGGNKICDVETTHLGSTESKEDAEFLWDKASAHGLLVRDAVPFKLYSD